MELFKSRSCIKYDKKNLIFTLINSKNDTNNQNIQQITSILTFIALSRREQVISTGTIDPFLMWVSINSPNSLPGLLLSSLKRSPADK